jgi:hypothetical protein
MRHVNSMIRRPVLLGHTGAGTPIWSIAGGADDGGGDDGGDGDDGDDGDDDGDDDGSEQLGDAGKKALDRMKAERRELKKQLRETKAELARAAAPPNKNGDGGGDDAPTAEKLRAQVRAELEAEGARDRALDKLEVKAAKRFTDPDIARTLLQSRADEFLDAQGKPDVDAITEALDELLTEKPYLAAQGSKWQGGGDGGARKEKPAEVKPGLARLRHAYAESNNK